MNKPTPLTKPKIISIEGNIGAGKSTIFNRLQEHFSDNPKIVFMKEPVELWNEFTDENGENMLVNYYRDPSKYSFGFQVMVYTTQYKLYMETLRSNPQCEIIISERSMDAARNVFTKMLHDNGHIDTIHFKIYDALYNTNKYYLDYIIYVVVDPMICYQRVNIRHREGENKISIDYLLKCQDYYQSWLSSEDEFVQLNYLSTCRQYYNELLREGGETDIDAPPRIVFVDGNKNDDGNYTVEMIMFYIRDILNTLL